jgi:hypothetical protein
MLDDLVYGFRTSGVRQSFELVERPLRGFDIRVAEYAGYENSLLPVGCDA